MAREDDWRDPRRWSDDRDAPQRRADYGPADNRYGYGPGDDDRLHPGYRAARGDAWLDARRRAERHEIGRERDERAFQPFGATGPTAYGPYGESPYAWGTGAAPYGMAAPYAGMSRGYGADYGPPRYETGRFGAPPVHRQGEPRSFLDKAADQVSAWFGDHGAERRREDELKAGHRGKGPRSYKRPDGRIQEDINDRLTEDPYVDATDIEVAVAGGDVTLTGVVQSREDKRRAERLAEEVSGVRDVQNNLRLRRFEAGDVGEKPSAGDF